MMMTISVKTTSLLIKLSLKPLYGRLDKLGLLFKEEYSLRFGNRRKSLVALSP